MARLKPNPSVVFFRLVLAAALGVLAASSSAIAQTCDQLKADLANSQRTLAAEQSALANCNAFPGRCSTGEIKRHQQAIETAQDQIAVIQAKLRGPDCLPPPPPPSFDHVTLEGIEVVQSIQDLANSVTLVADKPTFVRVYLGKNSSGTRTLNAMLQAKRGIRTIKLFPVAPITVDVTENLTTRRQNWSKSLNFRLPPELISPGSTTFSLATLTDISAAPKNIICDNCGTPVSATFLITPPLRIRAIGLNYRFPPVPGGPMEIASPSLVDYTLLRSWLSRAFPVARVEFSQSTAETAFNMTFGNDRVDCGLGNSQLAAIRADEINAGVDGRTHYIGLFSNQGGFVRGCAPIGGFVASGPAGPPGGPGAVPANAGGDTDGSFADWYNGHELAHSFGRNHAGFCNGNDDPKNGAIDPAFPYPNGQLSDATERSFAGLDVGDSANGIPVRVLWGGTSFDLMTYCQQPDWPSAHTYQGIRVHLLGENHGFNAQGQPLPPPLLVGPLVHVVALVNLTGKSGSINYVMPVNRAFPSPTANSRAELVVRDANEKELLRQSVTIQEMSDPAAGQDRIALIDATIPFLDLMSQIQLELDGVTIARYANERVTPPAVNGVKFVREPGSEETVISWNAPPASFGKITFTVEAEGAGNQLTTTAVGLKESRLAVLTADLAASRRLRITANNGFRASTAILVNLCSNQAKRVADLQREVDKLQEEIDARELPGPVIARMRARLGKLRQNLLRADIDLTRCLANNP